MILTNLFQRCVSKGDNAGSTLNNEYKVLVSKFTVDVLNILKDPLFPVASILIDTMVTRCVSELAEYCGWGKGETEKNGTALEGSATAVVGICKNINYTIFMMEILGIISQGIRSICLQGEQYDSVSSNYELTADVLGIIKKTFLSDSNSDEIIESNPSIAFLRHIITSSSIPVAAIQEPMSQKNKKKRKMEVASDNSPAKKNSRNILPESVADATKERNFASPSSVTSETSCMSTISAADIAININNVMRLLIDITATGLDILSQRIESDSGMVSKLFSSDEECRVDSESKYDDFKTSQVPDVSLLNELSIVVPTPWDILKQCGVEETVLRYYLFLNSSINYFIYKYY